ncbi:glutamate ABC transporter substrate-binding protein [Amycolatopsis suaedae]|uniref:Glutamate ABC transporter substrate-binding protein n=1 Tax=Amycolatopsis suaedae TaxID=2510978 RepID=A0A4Q7JFL1_9PSEU|nr:glutamate ABC transporter substrate-binding protein [Amycolatopsis suaedae]RZQ65374.1 glutamate ABC transporter substrate-binding protein [Amycolatopsis suaedae]
MTVRWKRVAVLGLVAGLLTACGSAGKPVDPAPVERVERPLPAGVVVGDRPPPAAAGTDCNATASLAPQGTGVTPGSTMNAIRQRGKLIVGVDQTTYLFGFRNPTSGQLEGFDIDIANEIAKAIFGTADGKVQYMAIPSSRREQVLENKLADVVVRTYSITCERLKKVAFSTEYYTAGQRVLAPKVAGVKSLADLKDKKVCATKTSTSLRKLASDPAGVVPVSVENWSDCLLLLQQGQVDAVSTDDTILAGMAAQDPTTEVVGERFTVESYGVGVPKENEDMVRFVNAVLEQVRGSAWQTSYNKWIAPHLGPGTPPAPKYK